MVAIPLLSLVALGATLIPSTQARQLSTRQTSEITYLGCFSSAGSLESQGLYTYQSSGYCTQICWKQSMTVAATGQGSECLCGNVPPASADLVPDSNCNMPCSGYPVQSCMYHAIRMSGLENE
jgi:cell wall integrity and stress response component